MSVVLTIFDFLIWVIVKRLCAFNHLLICACFMNFSDFDYYCALCGSSDGKEPTCQCRRPWLIPGLGRSLGARNGNPLQCSCLGNSMEGPWGHKELDMTEQLTLSLVLYN